MLFLDCQKLLCKNQYEFCAKHSTFHPILHLINEDPKNNNFNPCKYTLKNVCFLSKAFDVINHDILVKKT